MFWRILFLLELTIFALPVTGLAFVGIFYVLGRARAPDFASNAVMLTLGFIGLAGIWALSGFYLIGGPSGLRRAHWIAWVACCVGLLATAIGLAFPFLGISRAFPGFEWGIVGVPLLIPLSHLLMVRLR
jgi:hypothetical protein